MQHSIRDRLRHDSLAKVSLRLARHLARRRSRDPGIAEWRSELLEPARSRAVPPPFDSDRVRALLQIGDADRPAALPLLRTAILAVARIRRHEPESGRTRNGRSVFPAP